MDKMRLVIVTFQQDGSNQLAANAYAARAAALSSGKKTEKHVPLRPGVAHERNRIVPPCCSTIPFVTHKPNPVPLSPFVVKNGSKTRVRCSGAMPGPVSESVMRTPVRSLFPEG